VIDLERVATFLAVARYGGFREAAKHRGLSQPAVTQHIKRLEQSLNVSLIDRSPFRSTLTPEGRIFLPYAEHLLSICKRARTAFVSVQERHVAQGDSGMLFGSSRWRTSPHLF
jgi:DNA-binding transcriptional LysR family regulator